MYFIKIDKHEYRVVIKFFAVDGLSPKAIHSKLTKVYENSVPSISTVKSGQLNLNSTTHIKDSQKHNKGV